MLGQKYRNPYSSVISGTDILPKLAVEKRTFVSIFYYAYRGLKGFLNVSF